MTSRPTWPLELCLAIALVACQRTNPAFDQDDAGNAGTDDDGDTSTTQTNTTQTNTTQSTTDTGDGDGDPDAGDGDADTMDPPDTGMEDPIADMLPEACMVEPNPGLWPRFGRPEQFLNNTCPPGYSGQVRVWGSAGSDWLVGHCQLGCSGPCDMQTQWQLGADNLDPGPAVLYPQMGFNPNTPTVGCYYVEVEQNIKQTDGACYYASLSIHRHDGPSSPLLLNANREGYGLTQSAIVQYGDFMPQTSEQQLDTCVCDGLEFECCPGHTVVAKQFDLSDPVIPPSGTGTINLVDTAFTFLGAQAQSGTTCAVEPEISWAIWPAD